MNKIIPPGLSVVYNRTKVHYVFTVRNDFSQGR